MQKVITKSFFVHFLDSKQQDCQEDDGTPNIANLGGQTIVICQNEKDDGIKQNGKKDPVQTITDTDTNIANNYQTTISTTTTTTTTSHTTTATSPQTAGM